MIPRLVISLLGGPILKGLIESYKAKLDAANSADRIAADLAIAEIEAGLEARKRAHELRLATSGFWEMRLLTFAIAFPFVAHLWAVWLDTQFRLGWRIPKFPAPMDEWQGAIMLSFFGIYTLGKTVQSVGAAMVLRKR